MCHQRVRLWLQVDHRRSKSNFTEYNKKADNVVRLFYCLRFLACPSFKYMRPLREAIRPRRPLLRVDLL
jgi:hypothetical protein